tara:strand:- start:66 stop:308 length:243 start_codon:yes stop_codon:yes gene_type:complete
MKLVKTIDKGWVVKKYYDLGATSSKYVSGFDRKILIETLLETGQESKCRYRGSIKVDYDGDIRIETSTKPYSTKCKGFDY